MKQHLLFTRITILASILAVAGAGAARAQDTSTPPASGGTNGGDNGGWHHHFDKVLTPEERAQLKKDSDAVLSNDADLQKERDDLHTQMQAAKDGSADDKQALREKMHAFRDKLRDAVEKLDPSTVAIYAKLEAAHKAHEQGGDSGQTSGQ